MTEAGAVLERCAALLAVARKRGRVVRLEISPDDELTLSSWPNLDVMWDHTCPRPTMIHGVPYIVASHPPGTIAAVLHTGYSIKLVNGEIHHG